MFKRISGDPGDAGFGLVEVIVALSILVGLSIATAPFFFRAFESEASQGSRQDAVTVAGQRLDFTRALSRTRLLSGRTQAAVAAITSDPGLVKLSNDNLAGGATASDLNYDPTATATSVATVPPLSTQTVGSTVYTLRTYIDPCYRSAVKTNATCTASTTNGLPILRVSVDVSWNRISGVSCASARPGKCEFVTTTLRDATATDPTFDRNVSAPTATAASTIPSAEHAGESATLSITGTNFVAGAVITSDDPNDVVGPVASNTGTSATASYTASGTVGTRTLTITNSDGGNASVQFTVTQSAPAIATGGVTASSPLTAGTAALFTVTGSDFYSTGMTSSTPPKVTITEAGGVLPGTADATSSLAKETETVTLDATHKGSVVFIVSVTNADSGTVSFPITLNVKGQPPTITSVSATSQAAAPVAGSSENFTVVGSGFDSPPASVTVTEGGANLPCLPASTPAPTSTGFVCVAQLSSTLTGAQPFFLTAANADGTSVSSSSGTLLVLGAPAIMTATLTTSPASMAAAESFTITGNNLSAATGCSVKEGPTLLTGTVSNATLTSAVCTVTISPTLRGSQAFTVSITSPAGTASSTAQPYLVGPALTSLTITSGGNNVTLLTIGGLGFDTPMPKSIVITTPAYAGNIPGGPVTGTATAAVFSVPYASSYFSMKNNFTVTVTNADNSTSTMTFNQVST